MKKYIVVLAFKSGYQETIEINKINVLKIVQMWLGRKNHKWIPTGASVSYKSYPSYLWNLLPERSENLLKSELIAITIITK